MSFFKSFFEWWESKKNTQEQREKVLHHRFDDMLLDLKPQQESSEPSYRRKAPVNPHSCDTIVKSVEAYFKKEKMLNTDAEQNLKEAANIAQNAHFLSDDQRASSLLSLIGEEEAMCALRALRWRDGIYCPICGSSRIKKMSSANKHGVEKYVCLTCQEGGHIGEFTDITDYFDDYEMNSIRLWILIAYLKTFLPMSKVAKVLGMTLEQTIRLIDLMSPTEQHKNLTKKARRSDSYFS